MQEDIKTNYKVLARKYRPTNFTDLVGQEAVVTTISNAIKANRVAHAFLLTGIRGVGKTTTARIIAKTLNCTAIDMQQAVITPCGKCESCLAFAKDSHPDVIEMDAASKTGVNDIREVIESANYRPMMGRLKIYIIDEVHMLSTNAFNALLKTLEEPPSHTKFIFATTEVRKIPVTIISRCQRFDLRRLANHEMVDHLANIAKLEKINIETGALEVIALKSEGSVRDGLSLLDQISGFAQQNDITVAIVQNLLGIASRAKILDLFELLLAGDAKRMLDLFNQIYWNGNIAIVVIEDLMELVHLITRLKLVPQEAGSIGLAAFDQDRIQHLTSKLSIPTLTTIWQMLFKGLTEIRQSPNELAAAEMVLIRIVYLANIPTLAELINSIDSKSIEIKPIIASEQQVTHALPKADVKLEKSIEPVQQKQASINEPESYDQLVALFYEKKELILYHHLIEDVKLVAFNQSLVEVKLNNGVSKSILAEMNKLLSQWLGRKWQIILSEGEAKPTILEQQKNDQEVMKSLAKENQLVQAVFDNFNGAELVSVKKLV